MTDTKTVQGKMEMAHNEIESTYSAGMGIENAHKYALVAQAWATMALVQQLEDVKNALAAIYEELHHKRLS